MTPIDQTKLHSETVYGNCTEAALASLFEVGIGDVPAFSEMIEGNGLWYFALEEWAAARGWEVIRIDREFCPEGYYLASGPGPRGPSHMVVMKDGALAHDPHPSRAGLLKVESVYMFVPFDVARFRFDSAA
jgi:hypothetical protein